MTARSPSEVADLCRSLVEDSPLPLATTVGQAHVVNYASAAFNRLVGRAPGTAAGNPLAELVPETQAPAATALLDRVYRTGTGERIDLGEPGHTLGIFIVWPFVGDDGRPAGLVVHVSGTISLTAALRSDTGAAPELQEVNRRLLVASRKLQEQADVAADLSAALHEVAEERGRRLVAEQAARDEAEGALRLRDQFLSIAAHELRTPVTVVKGTAQLSLASLQHGTLDDARARRHLRDIVEAADRLEGLIRDLMDVSRMRSGFLMVEPASMDLAALVRKVARLFGDSVRDEHRLVTDVPDAPLLVQGDTARLEQVLDNLLSNAVKYSPGGGEIGVRLSQDATAPPVAAGVVLTITDTGIGLPPGERERIFQPFGRAANAARSGVAGMGLGLHISRQIIDRHGGRMWVDSAGEGQGSTFGVWLPTSTRAEAATPGLAPAR